MGQEDLSLPKDFAPKAPLSAELDRLGLEFMAEMLGIEVERRPDNLEARSDLGHLLTRLGRHVEALAVDRELVRRTPECETAHYNLACSLSLTGALDEALDELLRAVELGYADPDQLETDDDLVALRELPRFQALVERLRSSAG